MAADDRIIGFVMAVPTTVNVFPDPAPPGLETVNEIVLDITVAGVDGGLQAGHIAADLLWVIVLHAYYKGFRTTLSLATNLSSQVSLQHADFSILGDILYKSFE
ncbi:hypothetical protein BJX96DRAFT_173705 [Aspergillus floccosus]